MPPPPGGKSGWKTRCSWKNHPSASLELLFTEGGPIPLKLDRAQTATKVGASVRHSLPQSSYHPISPCSYLSPSSSSSLSPNPAQLNQTLYHTQPNKECIWKIKVPEDFQVRSLPSTLSLTSSLIRGVVKKNKYFAVRLIVRGGGTVL